MRRPLRWTAFASVLAFAATFIGFAPGARAEDRVPLSITILAVGGQPFQGGSNVGALATVCAAGPTCVDEQVLPIPASGVVEASLLPSYATSGGYGITITAYGGYVETHGLPYGPSSTTVQLQTIGQPTQLVATVSVDGVQQTHDAGGGGVFLCPMTGFTTGCVGPGQPGRQGQIVIMALDNTVHVALNSASDYNVRGLAFVNPGGTLVSDPATPVGRGSSNVSLNLNIVTLGTTYTGTVTRQGFEPPFPSNTLGVGACPQGTSYPTTCNQSIGNLRINLTGSDGVFALKLDASPTPWALAAFTIIDGAPVIGVERRILTSTSGTENLGAIRADISLPTATPSTTVDSPTGGSIGITTDGSSLVNVAALPVSSVLTPPPPNVELPFGVLSFTSPVPDVAACEAGGPPQTVEITLSFPGTPPGEWYKLRGGTWGPHPSTTNPDGSITLSITDGDVAGDDDGIVNCYVTDPGAWAVEPFDLLPPVSWGDDEVNTVRAGRTVPVKWFVAPGTDERVYGGVSWAPTSVGECAGDIAAVATVSGDVGELQDLGHGSWQVNTKTPPAGCWELTLLLAGEAHNATFRVR